MNWRELLQTLAITLAAVLSSLAVFSIVMLCAGVMPSHLYYWMYVGSFGTAFSCQNTLTRAAPLILTALCCALPARVGLIVIGGEGALVLGGLAAALTGLALAGLPPVFLLPAMAIAAMIAGGLLMGTVGLLRYARGVNETIASLLAAYIAMAVFNFLVEGPFRDPASLNKPSTPLIPPEAVLGNMFGMDVHWGLAFGILFCLAAYVLLFHTTFGFAARMVGGNARAALIAGLPVGLLMLVTCFLGGAAAGLAGMVEIAAVHKQANAALIAGYGFTGILVAFVARQQPLGILPVAILFGCLGASSGLVQRRLHVPEASMQVLMGILFVMILLFETLYGRFRVFQPRELRGTVAA